MALWKTQVLIPDFRVIPKNYYVRQHNVVKRNRENADDASYFSLVNPLKTDMENVFRNVTLNVLEDRKISDEMAVKKIDWLYGALSYEDVLDNITYLIQVTTNYDKRTGCKSLQYRRTNLLYKKLCDQGFYNIAYLHRYNNNVSMRMDRLGLDKPGDDNEHDVEVDDDEIDEADAHQLR